MPEPKGDRAARILVVDDDRAVRESLRRSLSFNGYSVELAQDGVEALELIASDRPDAVVLDVMMPRLDGLEVCRRLRSTGDDLPILVLTARDSVSERVAGLDAGADDYLTKPFDLGELQARLRALIRRASGAASPTLEHGEVRLEPAAKRVTKNGETVTLSAREYALLHDLMTHRNQLRTRAQLEDSLYAWGAEVESNTVEVYIHHLRKKLGSDFIRTVRGFGYQLGEKAGRETEDGEAPG